MTTETVQIPENTRTWEGEIATYWWDEGILISLSKGTLRTVEKIAANVALVKNITGNKAVPLLIYLADSPIPDKATRKFSTEQLPQIYSAMAMVSKPGLSRLIMNVLFSLKAPTIPMKSFTNADDARAWLKQIVN